MLVTELGVQITHLKKSDGCVMAYLYTGLKECASCNMCHPAPHVLPLCKFEGQVFAI